MMFPFAPEIFEDLSILFVVSLFIGYHYSIRLCRFPIETTFSIGSTSTRLSFLSDTCNFHKRY